MANAVHNRRHDEITKSFPLVFGQHGDVNDVEVPAAVADDSAHADGRTALLVDDVEGAPAAAQRGDSLGFSLGG